MTGSLSVQRILGGFLAPYRPDNVQTTRLLPKLMALEGFKRRVLGSIGVLKGKRKIDEETVKDLSKSLRRALLEADFNPGELGAILEGWDLSTDGRRDAALTKQREEYSSKKNGQGVADFITELLRD
mgnify:CR=1 FL=1